MIYIYIYPKKYGGVGARPPRISILNFSQLFQYKNTRTRFPHGHFLFTTGELRGTNNAKFTVQVCIFSFGRIFAKEERAPMLQKEECVRPFTRNVCKCEQCQLKPCSHALCVEARRGATAADKLLEFAKNACCCRTLFDKSARTYYGDRRVCFPCKEAIEAKHGARCCWWQWSNVPDDGPAPVLAASAYRTEIMPPGPALGPAPGHASGPALVYPKTHLPADASSPTSYICRQCACTVKKRPREYENGPEPHNWWWCKDCRETVKKPSAAELRRVRAATGTFNIKTFFKK